MSYVTKSLSTDEKLEHRFKFHWIIKIPIYLFHLLTLILAISLWANSSEPLTSGSEFLSVLPLVFSIMYHLSIVSTEHAVTSKRVIYKKGIISIKTEEQMLSKIETVEVRQGVLGRILGYGNIKITGTGLSFVVFKDIDNPLDVKKKIESLL